MNQSLDVVVVGGGIVGLSAAIAMRTRGFSVAIVDAGTLTVDLQTHDPRVYAVNKASQCLFEEIGVWPHILASSTVSPYRHMHVWDASSGACIDFYARMIGTDKLGVILQESLIKQALLERASSLDVVFFQGARVSSLQSDSDGVRLGSEGDNWHAKLLIVADGANSATRQRLGVSVTTWPYHQHAIVATIGTEKPHQETAYQVFHTQGPLAFLPLTDSHQCSIVWSTSTAHAHALMDLPDQAFAQQLTQAFSAKLGDCEVLSQRHQFPLHMRHVDRYSGLNWLLMGDAAHTIHPLAGLGLNVGLADLTTWLANLDANNLTAWSSKTLGAYQRQRKFAVWQTIALMGGLKTLFSNPLPPIVALRGFGLSACNRLSPLKRFFIEHAAG